MVLDNIGRETSLNIKSSAVFCLYIVNSSLHVVRGILIKFEYSFQKSSAIVLLLNLVSF